jgi:hypothetical protein
MRKEFLKFDARSKEAFNTAQLAALLARRGEFLSPVKTDAHGPDVIGYTPKTCVSRNIQVKSRITILEKYEGKDLYIAFPNWLDDVTQEWYVVDHDELQRLWGRKYKDWTSAAVSKAMQKTLAPYSVGVINLTQSDTE